MTREIDNLINKETISRQKISFEKNNNHLKEKG